jgi:putative polysaccharide polymerase
MFDFGFNHNVITKGTSLALLGMECFMLGSIFATKKEKHIGNGEIQIIKTKKLIFFLFLFFVIFFSISYTFFIQEVYTGGIDGVSVYIYLIYQSLLTVSIVLEFRNLYIAKRKNISYRISIAMLFMVFFTILAYLYLGVRGAAIYIICVLVVCYSIYYKPLGIRKFLIMSFVGAILMTFIAMTRSGTTLSENTDFRGDNIILGATMDLIINARTLYVCVDYVENHSILYGKTMIVTFLSFIPFSQRILFELGFLDISEASSGMFFTTLDFGKESRFGVGSNIIADVFLSFGMIGVIIFMYFLGYFQQLCQRFFISRNIKWILSYVVLIGYVLYMSRGEFFYPLKSIFWVNLMFLTVYSFQKLNRKINNGQKNI